MKVSRIVFVFIFSFYAFGAFSQSASEKKTLLFRLNPEVSWIQFKKQLPSYFQKINCEDKEFGLFSIEIPSSIPIPLALDALNRTGGCMFSQLSHKVNRRFTPNDPLISSQVYLDIIRAYTAWDYARGRGITGAGDTIVIAMIDDGLDTLQPDLAANVWKNHNEIPWNGIDEDSNGYKDDYWGWNGGDSNGRVVTSQTIGEGHGTQVAGVMAATTGNGIGIAGVSYATKVMPLLAYSTLGLDGELGVVRCMLYAWRQKKLYLSSKGKKGANIVVANFSLGIDRAFPKDAPLWCSMFDSLGNVGILSCGATTDANNDVDAVGDIPSTCPSPYLITVSFTNNSDQRVNSGFSPTQIDLAAPGQDIFTTIQRRSAGSNPPYAKNSGTSFSTPMVSGSIAFLYNHVCDSFLTFKKSNNDSALKLMKSWVLKGTDKLPSLAGKCLTEGRLNLLKVWQEMDLWCKSKDQKYSTEDLDMSKLVVFPNPISAGQNAHIRGFKGNNWQISILDISGKMVWKGNCEMEGNMHILPTKFLESGIYFVSFHNQTIQLVRKLQVL
jgi:Subtilase family/Secretion system C-terminal sorting domain